MRWRSLFGARAQFVVGVVFLLATVLQTLYWTIITPPTVMAVFLVSMEALLFASFNQLCSALGYRKTEHVEAQVADVEHADEVNVKS